MLYCSYCAHENQWSKTDERFWRHCEFCGELSYCHKRPASEFKTSRSDGKNFLYAMRQPDIDLVMDETRRIGWGLAANDSGIGNHPTFRNQPRSDEEFNVVAEAVYYRIFPDAATNLQPTKENEDSAE